MERKKETVMRTDELLRRVRDFWTPRRLRLAVWGIGGFMLGVLIAEIGLNLWVRSALRANLLDQNGRTRLEASLAWLSLPKLIRGEVDAVKVKGADCRINDLRLSQLRIESSGFRFDLPLLLRERQLRITALNRTRLSARLTETALGDYLNLCYPGYNLGVGMLADRLRLTGIAEIFGSKVPVLLEGGLSTTGPRELRFYPDRLLVGGRSVGQSLLQFVGDQIPLEFSLLERWPVTLSRLSLRPGYLELAWRETGPKKG